MSAILRWFHDGDVRYRAYFRVSESMPAKQELIVASRDGQAVDIVERNRSLEDFSYAELLVYARRLSAQQRERAELRAADAAAD